MGILNITPDSFYDGGKLASAQAITDRAGAMLADGAAILDIGGHSTRPGAATVSESEETERVLRGIEAVFQADRKAIVSVDTFRSHVARAAVQAGASMVNDVSGGEQDAAMFTTVAELQVPYILMHMQGTPATMQQAPRYADAVQEVYDSLQKRVATLQKLNVKHVIIDPGFGFGKTVAHNYALLRELPRFHAMGVPVLAGMSRKSMINKVLNTKPSEALNGTTVVNTIALLHGAHLLRVHDVREACEAVKLVKALLLPQ